MARWGREAVGRRWGAVGGGRTQLYSVHWDGNHFISSFVRKWCLARLVFPIYCTKKQLLLYFLYICDPPTIFWLQESLPPPFSLRIILPVLASEVMSLSEEYRITHADFQPWLRRCFLVLHPIYLGLETWHDFPSRLARHSVFKYSILHKWSLKHRGMWFSSQYMKLNLQFLLLTHWRRNYFFNFSTLYI